MALILAIIGVGGCGSIELEPEPPVLARPGNLGTDAAELVVIVPPGQAGYKWAWAILVDGEPRAWLRNAAGYTRIRVAPGRWIGYFLIFPIPDIGSDRNARVFLDCPQRTRCGMVVERHHDSAGRLSLTAFEARAEQIAEALKQLDEHPSGLLKLDH